VAVVSTHQIVSDLVSRKSEAELVDDPCSETASQADSQHVAGNDRVGCSDIRNCQTKKQSAELTSLRKVACVTSREPLCRREIMIDTHCFLTRVLNRRRFDSKTIRRTERIC